MRTETRAWRTVKIKYVALAGVKESQVSLESAFYKFLDVRPPSQGALLGLSHGGPANHSGRGCPKHWSESTQLVMCFQYVSVAV